jgi:NAD-dependent dihydropyrimidine dehydrogenase PreA subunit
VSSAQHYFVVTTVSGADEGPASAEVAATAATGSLDTDNDGSPDCLDACPADTAKESPGACGCGRADLDSDGDGTADCVDMCPMDSVNQCNSEPMDNSNDNTAPGDDPMDNPGDPMDNPSDPMPTDEVSDGDVTGETSDVANCGDGACGVGMAGFMPFMAAGMWSTRRRRNASRS